MNETDALVESINEAIKTLQSLRQVARTDHMLKHNRINALEKRRYELCRKSENIIRNIDTEITFTRSRKDFKKAYVRRPARRRGQSSNVV